MRLGEQHREQRVKPGRQRAWKSISVNGNKCSTSRPVRAHCRSAAPAATTTKASHTTRKPWRTRKRRQRSAMPCTISRITTLTPIGA
jgi:hypothetical protein